jgi:hypothetical protein
VPRRAGCCAVVQVLLVFLVFLVFRVLPFLPSVILNFCSRVDSWHVPLRFYNRVSRTFCAYHGTSSTHTASSYAGRHAIGHAVTGVACPRERSPDQHAGPTPRGSLDSCLQAPRRRSGLNWVLNPCVSAFAAMCVTLRKATGRNRGGSV